VPAEPAVPVVRIGFHICELLREALKLIDGQRTEGAAPCAFAASPVFEDELD
jgi:hypothetical protein